MPLVTKCRPEGSIITPFPCSWMYQCWLLLVNIKYHLPKLGSEMENALLIDKTHTKKGQSCWEKVADTSQITYWWSGVLVQVLLGKEVEQTSTASSWLESPSLLNSSSLISWTPLPNCTTSHCLCSVILTPGILAKLPRHHLHGWDWQERTTYWCLNDISPQTLLSALIT